MRLCYVNVWVCVCVYLVSIEQVRLFCGLIGLCCAAWSMRAPNNRAQSHNDDDIDDDIMIRIDFCIYLCCCFIRFCHSQIFVRVSINIFDRTCIWALYECVCMWNKSTFVSIDLLIPSDKKKNNNTSNYFIIIASIRKMSCLSSVCLRLLLFCSLCCWKHNVDAIVEKKKLYICSYEEHVFDLWFPCWDNALFLFYLLISKWKQYNYYCYQYQFQSYVLAENVFVHLDAMPPGYESALCEY